MSDPVDHPQHYNQGGPVGEDGTAQYEVIKIIEDLGWGFEFCMGNALKYVLRAPYKGAEEQDLAKARWYLERAKLRGGSVCAGRFRKIDIEDAVEAWGLRQHHLYLGLTVRSISYGDPVAALHYLAAHAASPSVEVG